MTSTTALTYIGDSNPSGMQWGKASTDKLGFWGTTPVVQPTAATAVSTSVPVSTTGGVFGFNSSAQVIALLAAVNQLITNNALTGLDA